MIIWNGWGFLVAVIVFVSSLVAEILVEGYYGDDTYYQTAAWPLALALVVAGFFSWLWGARLNRAEPGNGPAERSWLAARHRLFFIPMQYWGPILLAAAVAVLLFRSG